MTKIIFDHFAALILLGLFFPIFLFVIIIMGFQKTGPIFFIQDRIGKNNSIFRLIKFRTMCESTNIKKDTFDAGNTNRVTPIGSILRKTKLDEIPQLINVFKGDMSIVGPRPEVKQWTEVYPEKWKIVHSVKPGITDNASIEFRNEEEILANSEDPIATYRDIILPRKLDLYIDYVNNLSFWGDIRIILKTIKVVIFK